MMAWSWGGGAGKPQATTTGYAGRGYEFDREPRTALAPPSENADGYERELSEDRALQSEIRQRRLNGRVGRDPRDLESYGSTFPGSAPPVRPPPAAAAAPRRALGPVEDDVPAGVPYSNGYGGDAPTPADRSRRRLASLKDRLRRVEAGINIADASGETATRGDVDALRSRLARAEAQGHVHQNGDAQEGAAGDAGAAPLPRQSGVDALRDRLHSAELEVATTVVVLVDDPVLAPSSGAASENGNVDSDVDGDGDREAADGDNGAVGAPPGPRRPPRPAPVARRPPPPAGGGRRRRATPRPASAPPRGTRVPRATTRTRSPAPKSSKSAAG